jgi:hypothetical protein
MKIDLDQEDVNLIAEVLRIQIDLADRAQRQSVSSEDLPQSVMSSRQIERLQEVLTKFQPPIVPD